MKHTTFRQPDVARAVKAVRSAQVSISGVEIAPGGTIRVLTGDGANSKVSPFDTWKQKADARQN